MASGVEARIAELLFEYIGTLSLSQSLNYAEPSVSFTPEAGTPYIRVDHLPNGVETLAVGSGENVHTGLLQLSVMWPVGEGAIAPLEIASELQSAFDKGLLLNDAVVRLKFNTRPSVTGPIYDGPFVMYPVTIQYSAYAQ